MKKIIEKYLKIIQENHQVIDEKDINKLMNKHKIKYLSDEFKDFLIKYNGKTFSSPNYKIKIYHKKKGWVSDHFEPYFYRVYDYNEIYYNEIRIIKAIAPDYISFGDDSSEFKFLIGIGNKNKDEVHAYFLEMDEIFFIAKSFKEFLKKIKFKG